MEIVKRFFENLKSKLMSKERFLLKWSLTETKDRAVAISWIIGLSLMILTLITSLSVFMIIGSLVFAYLAGMYAGEAIGKFIFLTGE